MAKPQPTKNAILAARANAAELEVLKLQGLWEENQRLVKRLGEAQTENAQARIESEKEIQRLQAFSEKLQVDLAESVQIAATSSAEATLRAEQNAVLSAQLAAMDDPDVRSLRRRLHAAQEQAKYAGQQIAGLQVAIAKMPMATRMDLARAFRERGLGEIEADAAAPTPTAAAPVEEV